MMTPNPLEELQARLAHLEQERCHDRAALRRIARRARLSWACAVAVLASGLVVGLRPAALAQSPGTSLASLVAAITALQNSVASLQTTVTSLQSTVKDQGSSITTLQSQQKKDETQESNDVTGLMSKQSTDAGNIIALQTKTAAISVSSDPSAGGTNTLLTFTGVNVQIVNGAGFTPARNGLGNLIVGYNESDGSETHTGSHNIVGGIYNNYASTGGIVGGYNNSINGFAAFAVGSNNVASGNQASVSGGTSNTASGAGASVSGGTSLTQTNQFGWSGGTYHSP